jgi:hypothetical protein
MKVIETVFTTLFVIFYLVFPLWVAVHSWRKGYKVLSVVTGISYLIPFLPLVIAVIAFFIVKPQHPNMDYSPSPREYVGWGTKFYCSSEKQSDGSFITTQWFTVFYIPLVPIQSYRIIMGASDYKWRGYTSTSTRYFEILEIKKIQRKHLLKVYLFLLSFPLVLLSMSPLLISGRNATSLIGGFLIMYIIAGYFLLRAK